MTTTPKPETILLVDDHPTNIDILVGLLESEYDLLVSLDGPGALEIARSEKIDLILLDIMMPGMSGLEVCRTLKSDPKTAAVPIVFITARDEDATIEEAFEIGGDDYVTKPFKPKELKARVKNRLELSSYQNELKRRVEEETAKRLEREKLLFRQSRLAAMGEMVDAVAHQWLQPIQVILAYSSELEMDYEDGLLDAARIREFHMKMTAQTEHMVSTLREFRSFLSPGKDARPFDLERCAQSVLLLMRDELMKNMVQVSVTCETPVTVTGSENEFKHVLINLVNNAKDAFVEKNVQERHVRITLQSDAYGAKIRVWDNAGGIPEAVIGRVFDANVTTKEEGKGSGIGLYMSRMIIEKQGGTIGVENHESGALFTITLPRF